MSIGIMIGAWVLMMGVGSVGFDAAGRVLYAGESLERAENVELSGESVVTRGTQTFVTELNVAESKQETEKREKRGETKGEDMSNHPSLPRVMKLSDVDPKSIMFDDLPGTVRAGLAWLQQTDLTTLPLGVTEIDGTSLFVNVQEYATRPVEEFKVEGHRKYFDIQVILSGDELIGMVTYCDTFAVDEPYDAEKDVIFFAPSAMPFLSKPGASPGKLILTAGEFVIFSPNDLHAPCLTNESVSDVKKIVVKCQIGE